MRTFGRARRRRPYAFCLRELRADVRPYGFVWADYVWTVDVVWVDCTWKGWFRLGGLRVNGILFVWDCVEKYYGAW